MSFTFSDFQARFPELASVDENFYNQAKASALLSVNPKVWCLKTDEGVKQLTAHYIALKDRGGVAGQVKRVVVGDLEREYDNSSGSDDASTSYMNEFIRLRNTLVISPMFIC